MMKTFTKLMAGGLAISAMLTSAVAATEEKQTPAGNPLPNPCLN